MPSTGSGPGQKFAFDDAMAHVGCPDHRPCWKHVSDMTGSALRVVGPFQPSHRVCRRDPRSTRRSQRCAAASVGLLTKL